MMDEGQPVKPNCIWCTAKPYTSPKSCNWCVAKKPHTSPQRIEVGSSRPPFHQRPMNAASAVQSKSSTQGTIVSWHRSWSRNWWYSRHRNSRHPYVVGLVDKVDPASCQSLPSRAFSSRPPRLRQGAQLPPLGAPTSLPHGLVARNGAFHIACVAAVAPAYGTLVGILGIALEFELET